MQGELSEILTVHEAAAYLKLLALDGLSPAKAGRDSGFQDWQRLAFQRG